MDDSEYSFRLVRWDEVRHEVQEINPELAKIVDAISPDKHYPLVKASYRFGDLIINEGMTYLPGKKGDLLPVTDPGVQTTLKDQLSYSPIPLFLILKNASEVFVHSASRTIPLNLFYPGHFLGLFESIDFLFNRQSPLARWSVSAGARHLFTLPKIGESENFRKLRAEYGLTMESRPHSLMDHFSLFRAIAHHPAFNSSWKNDVLFFTQNWLKNHHRDQYWLAFKENLFKFSWEQAQFSLGRTKLNIAWEHFSSAMFHRHLKPLSYLTDHIKHVLLIAMRHSPGFKPADKSNQVAPINDLQKAIVDVYSLKKYYPTMMHTTSLAQNAHLPIYYSLSYPSLLEGMPYKKNASTILADLRKIKLLIDSIQPVFSDAEKIEGNIFRNIHLNYFHVEADKYQEIQPSQNLPDLDPTFLNDQDYFPDRQFCATSSFWRGCLQIYPSSPL